MLRLQHNAGGVGDGDAANFDWSPPSGATLTLDGEEEVRHRDE